MHLPRQNIELFQSYSAVTKSNQPISSPGPGDYVVKKPLPQTATVSKLSESRNLYKAFEPNPGPGAYEPKSYITVQYLLFRMGKSDR